MAQKRKDPQDEAKYLLNYATFLGESGDFAKAEKLLLDALPKTEDNVFYKAVALNSLSMLYNATEKYEKARRNALAAFQLIPQIKNVMFEAEVNTNLANAYYGLGEYQKSIETNEKVIKVAEQNKLPLQLCNAYGNIYLNYKALGDFKRALTNFEKYHFLKDSLANVEIATRINELHTKYETEKKEAELKAKDRELKIQAGLNKAYLVVIIITAISMISLTILHLRQSFAYRALVRVNLNILKEQKKVENIKALLKTTLGKKYHYGPEIVLPESVKTKVLSDEKKREIVSNIYQLVEKKTYLDPEMSLDKMSTMLNTNSKYLSQVIHEIFRTNFANFIQELRVNEARQLLVDPKYENYAIDAISEMAGFKSKQAFNLAFKKLTGVTPTYYKTHSKLVGEYKEGLISTTPS